MSSQSQMYDTSQSDRGSDLAVEHDREGIVFHDRMWHRFAPVIAILMAGLIAVESSAQITILEPRAGSDYERGDNLTIRWECRGATMSTEWDVKLIFDDGREHVDGDIVKWRPIGREEHDAEGCHGAGSR